MIFAARTFRRTEPAEERALHHKKQAHFRFPGMRAVFALILREMATTYGRSPGGYAWAILEPVAGVALMTILFSIAFPSPPIGESFALFYATGLLPFMFYQESTQKIGIAIQYSRPLLAYPNVVFLDAILGRLILNTLTQILIFALIVGGLVVSMDLAVVFDFPALLQALGMLIALVTGVGVLNCYVMSRFPIWQRIWAILNRPLFIISGIFILLDELPEPYREYSYYNPVAHILSQTRTAFYPFYEPSILSPLYVYCVSFVLAFFGVLLLYRYHSFILDEGA